MRDLLARMVGVAIVAAGFAVLALAEGNVVVLLLGAGIVTVGAMLLIVGDPT